MAEHATDHKQNKTQTPSKAVVQPSSSVTDSALPEISPLIRYAETEYVVQAVLIATLINIISVLATRKDG